MAEAVFVMEMGGEEMLTTVDVFLGAVSAADAALYLADFWAAGPGSVLSQDLALVGVQLLGEFYPQTATGAVNQPSSPSSVAAVARKNVVGGNSGRFFFPGVAENNVDAAGRLIQSFVPLFNSATATALATLNGLGVEMRVVQKDLTTPTVESITCQPIVGTQRRRLAKR